MLEPSLQPMVVARSPREPTRLTVSPAPCLARMGPEPETLFRGRFLARGSLSLAGGRTHLEFVVPLDAGLLGPAGDDIGAVGHGGGVAVGGVEGLVVAEVAQVGQQVVAEHLVHPPSGARGRLHRAHAIAGVVVLGTRLLPAGDDPFGSAEIEDHVPVAIALHVVVVGQPLQFPGSRLDQIHLAEPSQVDDGLNEGRVLLPEVAGVTLGDELDQVVGVQEHVPVMLAVADTLERCEPFVIARDGFPIDDARP